MYLSPFFVKVIIREYIYLNCRRGAVTAVLILGDKGLPNRITIHETAEIGNNVLIGKGTFIWHQTQVRDGAVIGEQCVVGKGVYIDSTVVIGNNVKIQNRATIYGSVIISNEVSIGPQVCFSGDYQLSKNNLSDFATRVKTGATIGANSLIMPRITIGKGAVVGAKSVVTTNVPDYAIVQGNPAKVVGYICSCGRRLTRAEKGVWACYDCNRLFGTGALVLE
jgi:acetyltransferase-like isoleucine patch superfamily enzyme